MRLSQFLQGFGPNKTKNELTEEKKERVLRCIGTIRFVPCVQVELYPWSGVMCFER